MPRSSAGAGSSRAHRVIASLNREQVDVLDKIGKDALFSAGVKLSRTQILSALVNLLKRFEVTGEGVHSLEEFETRLWLMAREANGRQASSSHAGDRKRGA